MIDKWSFRFLVFFVKRPGMYTGEESIELIEAFLMGLRMGSKYSLDFHNRFVNRIFEKYDNFPEIVEIQNNRCVNPFKDQIKILSKKFEITELALFKKESMELLVEISDKENGGLYAAIMTDYLKEAIVEELQEQYKPDSNSFFSSKVNHIFKELIGWSGITISKQIQELLEEFKTEKSKQLNDWHSRHENSLKQKPRIDAAASNLKKNEILKQVLTKL